MNQRSWIFGGFLLWMAVPLGAQTNSEVNAGIQFNFSTPGARSLSLGGAFIGLADDATAAYTNPAGLTTLGRPEVSLEGRHWAFRHAFADRGHVLGPPSGRGVDTIAGLQTGEDWDEALGVSFLSLVYPLKHWRFAFYRHELAHFRADHASQGVFFSESGKVGRLQPTRNTLHLDIVNYGSCFAYEVTEGLSLGFGLTYSEFSYDALTLRHRLAEPPGNTAPGGFLGPPLLTDDNVQDIEEQAGEDHDFGFNAGFTWEINDFWKLGGVFRSGPDFEFLARDSFRAPNRPPLQRPRPPLREGEPGVRKGQFATPDVYGLGLVWQPTDFLTFALDANRVEYSALSDSFVIPFRSESVPNEFQVDDVTEIHFGAERVVSLPRFELALRAGAWLDPDHKIRYTGRQENLKILFQPGEDEIHYTAGVGFSGRAKGWEYQIDAAFDLSDRVQTSSLSTVVRF
jgi:long-chain fatty acid transport protein